MFRQADASTRQGGYYLIAGLGNPGREYRQTRHNIGFMLLDALAKSLNLSFSRVKSKALVTRGDYSGRRLVLAKPQTYMNLSGQAIGAGAVLQGAAGEYPDRLSMTSTCPLGCCGCGLREARAGIKA